MAILDYAIAHARAGRLVFPGRPNGKTPAIDNPYAFATTDEKQIMRWWKDDPRYNICLPMGIEIEPGKFLGAIDFDSKHEAFKTKDFLEDFGMEFPETLTQTTTSFGEHRLYTFQFLLKNGVGFLGPGIDHRGFHGYIVGAGSWYHGKEYVFKNALPVAAAPGWLALKLFKQTEPKIQSQAPAIPVDQVQAYRQAQDFLDRLPTAQQGQRNQEAFKAAAIIRDFGLNQQEATNVMIGDWRSDPELSKEEIEGAVSSAYRYAKDVPGNRSPESAFTVIPETPKLSLAPVPADPPKNPLDALNDKYAFITIGGDSRILRKTFDPDGNPKTDTLRVGAFHEALSTLPPMYVNGKEQAQTQLWMKWPGRKTFEGLMFEPGKENPRFYNTWHGFSVPPWAENEKPTEKAVIALEKFKDHIKRNVALGNEEHANWILGWFADLFQNPGKKPRTALVLRGKKGVGKSAIFGECLAQLLGAHYLSVSHKRYLTGNFNAHLEGKILYVLEEAFWTKDKNAEGVLKTLVTEKMVQIERKGQESYTSKNFCRVVILGNEEWVVPTSEDERRYAVFDVAETNRNDKNFFSFIDDMDHRLLYKFFMEFDLSKVDINTIPKTDALLRQKEHSADALHQWWAECLRGGTVGPVWPELMHKEEFRRLFREEMKMQNYSGALPSDVKVGMFLKKVMPSIITKRVRDGTNLSWYYTFPTLTQARKEWAALYEHKEMKWADADPPPEEITLVAGQIKTIQGVEFSLETGPF